MKYISCAITKKIIRERSHKSPAPGGTSLQTHRHWEARARGDSFPPVPVAIWVRPTHSSTHKTTKEEKRQSLVAEQPPRKSNPKFRSSAQGKMQTHTLPTEGRRKSWALSRCGVGRGVGMGTRSGASRPRGRGHQPSAARVKGKARPQAR